MRPQTSAELRVQVKESLCLALLCSLEPAGAPFETYEQKAGIVKYASLESHVKDPTVFLEDPLYLASGVLPTLSDLVMYEMSFEKGLGTDGWLETIARYPFLFASFAVAPKTDGPIWEMLKDVTFTHFIMFGGKTGIGNDVIGFVISQESQPGVILESAAFQAPSSVIAPGYTQDLIDIVHQQEKVCIRNLLALPTSVLSSFIAEVKARDVSEIDLKVLYGFSTSPFNDIDKVITNIGKKANQRRPRKIPS